MTAPLRVADLGRQSYQPVLGLQRALVRARLAGALADDVLLLVEHEPVITLGRGTRAESLPLPAAELERRGYAVAEAERGGDVTLHAPGQLVGYPILDLAGHRKDLHWYLRALEEVLIGALDALGVAAARRTGLTGVWVGERKIASIGVHVKQWVTLHGFALNVTTDLSLFDVIVPCGIPDVVMTSVAKEIANAHREGAAAATVPPGPDGQQDGLVPREMTAALRAGPDDHPPGLDVRAREAVVAAFARVFARRPVPTDPDAIGSAAGVPAPENAGAPGGVGAA